MKTALITGAAKRIGKELAVHLSKQNYRVVIHYNTSKNEAEKIKESFPNTELVFGNLKHSDSARFVLDQIKGDVDVIINNAANFENDSVTNFTFDSFYQHMMINLHTPISFIHEAITRYESCSIINVLDSWAFDNPQNFLSYCVSKNSLRNATLQIAKQLKTGFRVNGISLGAAMHKDGYPKDVFEKLQEKYPTNIEDICKAVDNILSDEAMNGEIIDLVK